MHWLDLKQRAKGNKKIGVLKAKAKSHVLGVVA